VTRQKTASFFSAFVEAAQEAEFGDEVTNPSQEVKSSDVSTLVVQYLLQHQKTSQDEELNEVSILAAGYLL